VRPPPLHLLHRPRYAPHCAVDTSSTAVLTPPCRLSYSFSTQGQTPLLFLNPPPPPISLSPISCFLTLDSQRIRVWDAAGACITDFEDHVLTPATQVRSAPCPSPLHLARFPFLSPAVLILECF
jgi:hypothetical protein